MIAYPIVIFRDDEEDTFIADVPDLKYCSAHGDTPEEALREIKIAMTLWLGVARNGVIRSRSRPVFQPDSGRHPDQLIRGTTNSVAGAES